MEEYDAITNLPKTSALSDAHETNKINSDILSLNVHDQYLDQLYRQYNIDVKHALLFYIGIDTEPIIFVDKEEINIGRGDSRGRITPEFDLGLYDGSMLGVSRLHARIVRENERYLIQDLASTNGTWLNGQKIMPYQWYTLEDGHMLQYGKLGMTAFMVTR